MILICFYFIYLQEEAPLLERDPGETIKASPMFTLEDVFKSENRYDGDSVRENDLIDGEDYNLPGMDEEDYNSHGMDEEHDFELNSNVYPTDKLDTNLLDRDRDFEPLYPGAKVSVGSFMLLLAVFTSRYNLIGDATQQLLNILSLVLPAGHKLCTTLHEFKKFFVNLKNPLKYHYYCSYCTGIIEDSNVNKCSNTECGQKFDKKKANYFLEMPVKDQMRNLFKQDGFHEMIQHRFKRRVKEGTYEDIYDGDVYKSHFDNNGILNNPNNVSFSFNTDGASVFKSSNVSVWPLFLIINELPYKIRMKKENMLLASLWFGNKKPSMCTFLKPFKDSMEDLFQGIECSSPSAGTFICKGILLCGTADLPARSILCNHIQYNGAFSCWKCEQEGKTANVGKGHARIFPYDTGNPKGPQRTQENIVENSQLALQTSKIVKGIKGPSWLLFFPCFNINEGIAIDYMHGVLLGVEKLLIELWFSQKYSQKAFSLYHQLNTVNNRLLSIHPTLDITRLPRSLLDLQHWKASEFRSFLLFYSTPILNGVMDNERFSHYLLLVNSMHILLKQGCSKAELDKAEAMLLDFCFNFKDFYEECFMRLNIHQLLHLPDCVRKLGPLYTSSCFSFESKNGVLLKMIRGSQNIDNQIITGVSFVQKLPELKNKCIKKGSECEKLYDLIENTTAMKRTLTVEQGFYILGAISETALSDDECEAIQIFLGECNQQEKYLSFKRIEFRDSLIYGLNYSRMMKRDNSTVEYKSLYQNDNSFGQIKHFINLGKDINAENILAIIEPLSCPNYSKEINILRVRREKVIKFIRVLDIIGGCMVVSYNRQEMFVCRFPNKLESD